MKFINSSIAVSTTANYVDTIECCLPGYMAPELFASKTEYGLSSDIFSCGLIFYTL